MFVERLFGERKFSVLIEIELCIPAVAVDAGQNSGEASGERFNREFIVGVVEVVGG